MTERAKIITFRAKNYNVPIASQLSPAMFERLEKHCKRVGVLKAEIIRRALEEYLDRHA